VSVTRLKASYDRCHACLGPYVRSRLRQLAQFNVGPIIF